MMDQVWAWVGTFVLGMSAVTGFILKYKGRVKRAIRIVNEGLDVLEGAMLAVEDGKLTKSEIELILREFQELKAVLEGKKK